MKNLFRFLPVCFILLIFNSCLKLNESSLILTFNGSDFVQNTSARNILVSSNYEDYYIVASVLGDYTETKSLQITNSGTYSMEFNLVPVGANIYVEANVYNLNASEDFPYCHTFTGKSENQKVSAGENIINLSMRNLKKNITSNNDDTITKEITSIKYGEKFISNVNLKMSFFSNGKYQLIISNPTTASFSAENVVSEGLWQGNFNKSGMIYITECIYKECEFSTEESGSFNVSFLENIIVEKPNSKGFNYYFSSSSDNQNESFTIDLLNGLRILYGTSIGSGFVKVMGATVSGEVSGSSVFIEDRTLSIGNLYVCDHEVTQKEYETYCKYGSSDCPSDTYGVGDNYPAYYVNWYDAIVYCNLRSMAEGLSPVYVIDNETDPKNWTGIGSAVAEGSVTKYCGPSSINTTWNALTYDTTADGYRLPTEAEWEYIARGGNGGIPETQYTYSGSDTKEDVAWFSTNSSGKTHEVKTLSANNLGIYDMSGNVYEWCYDWYGDISSSTEASGPVSGSQKVDRSGSIINDSCNVANRGYSEPNRYYLIGFRIVRNAE